MLLTREEFEKLVAQALDELPDFVQEKMTNVEVPHSNLGLAAGNYLEPTYHRVILCLACIMAFLLTRRSHFYAMVPPDTITLYQGPNRKICWQPGTCN